MAFGSYVFYDSVSALELSFRQGMGISDSELGVLYAVYNIPNTFMVVAGGILADRIGLRRAVLLYTGLVALGAFLFCLGLGTPFGVRSYWLLVVGRLIFGLGAESSYVAQDSVIAAWFRGGAISLAMSFQVSAGRLGDVFGYSGLPPLAEFFGDYAWAMWLAAALCMLSLPAAVLFVVLDRRAERTAGRLKDSSGHEQTAESRFSVREVLRFPASYWALALLVVCVYAAVFSFLAFCPEYLHAKFGLNETEAGHVTTIISLSTMLLAPLLGFLLDRTGRRPYVVTGGTLIMLVAFLLLTFSRSPVYVPMALVGAGFSLVSAGVWPCVALLVRTETLGTAFGIVAASINGALMFVNYAVGSVFNKHDLILAELGWIGMTAAAFGTSIVWNIIDWWTSGVASQPSSRTVDVESVNHAGDPGVS